MLRPLRIRKIFFHFNEHKMHTHAQQKVFGAARCNIAEAESVDGFLRILKIYGYHMNSFRGYYMNTAHADAFLFCKMLVF